MASTGETQQPQQQSSDNHEDEHSVPDVELLTFQKQRSTPKVRLSEMCVDGSETLHAEIDDFGAMSGGQHIGLAAAGHEENVIRQLHHAGSLDASSILPDVGGATGGAEESKQ